MSVSVDIFFDMKGRSARDGLAAALGIGLTRIVDGQEAWGLRLGGTDFELVDIAVEDRDLSLDVGYSYRLSFEISKPEVHQQSLAAGFLLGLLNRELMVDSFLVLKDLQTRLLCCREKNDGSLHDEISGAVVGLTDIPSLILEGTRELING